MTPLTSRLPLPTDDGTISDIDPDWPHSWWTNPGLVQYAGHGRRDHRRLQPSPVRRRTRSRSATNAVIRVGLDGSNSQSGSGLTIEADGCNRARVAVPATSINAGIELQSSDNVVEGNFNRPQTPRGRRAVGHGSYGVVIDAGSTCVNNHIGGSTPASAQRDRRLGQPT